MYLNSLIMKTWILDVDSVICQKCTYIVRRGKISLYAEKNSLNQPYLPGNLKFILFFPYLYRIPYIWPFFRGMLSVEIFSEGQWSYCITSPLRFDVPWHVGNSLKAQIGMWSFLRNFAWLSHFSFWFPDTDRFKE